MILFDGKTYESSEQDRLLNELEKRIPEILAKEQLSPEVVIDAVDKLRIDTMAGKFDICLQNFRKISLTLIRSRQRLFFRESTFIKNLRQNWEVQKNISQTR